MNARGVIEVSKEVLAVLAFLVSAFVHQVANAQCVFDIDHLPPGTVALTIGTPPMIKDIWISGTVTPAGVCSTIEVTIGCAGLSNTQSNIAVDTTTGKWSHSFVNFPTTCDCNNELVATVECDAVSHACVGEYSEKIDLNCQPKFISPTPEPCPNKVHFSHKWLKCDANKQRPLELYAEVSSTSSKAFTAELRDSSNILLDSGSAIGVLKLCPKPPCPTTGGSKIGPFAVGTTVAHTVDVTKPPYCGSFSQTPQVPDCESSGGGTLIIKIPDKEDDGLRTPSGSVDWTIIDNNGGGNGGDGETEDPEKIAGGNGGCGLVWAAVLIFAAAVLALATHAWVPVGGQVIFTGGWIGIALYFLLIAIWAAFKLCVGTCDAALIHLSVLGPLALILTVLSFIPGFWAPVWKVFNPVAGTWAAIAAGCAIGKP